MRLLCCLVACGVLVATNALPTHDISATTLPSLLQAGGDITLRIDSDSRTCASDSVNDCNCCCSGVDAAGKLVDCQKADAWMVNETCPVGFPHSTPSWRCNNNGFIPFRSQVEKDSFENSTCSNSTSATDLLTLCQLDNCPSGVPQSCDCLNKYITSCFAVGASTGVKEPCALTRDMARAYLIKKGCDSQESCSKPSYLTNTPLIDDCQDETTIGGTCKLNCATGYVSTTSSQEATIMCTLNGWEVSNGALECVEGNTCDLPESFGAAGVVHDCENLAPIGAQCVAGCAAGFTLNVTGGTQGRVNVRCELADVNATKPTYSKEVNCTPSYCSPAEIPAPIVHNCEENTEIGAVCSLSCPVGYEGGNVTATCVGHGGRTSIAHAEFQFNDLVCSEHPPQMETSIEKLVTFGISSGYRVRMELNPPFNPNVTSYTLRLPYRFSEIKFEPTTTNINYMTSSRCASNCTMQQQEQNQASLSEGSQVIELIVNSTSGNPPPTTYTITVKRESDSVGEGAAGVARMHELRGSIRFAEPLTPTWQNEKGAGVIQVLARYALVPEENVTITAVREGSVIVEFQIAVFGDSGRVRDLLNEFDHQTGGDMATWFCGIANACSDVAVLDPLLEDESSVVLPPTATATPPPPPPPPTATNQTGPSFDMSRCDEPEAQQCTQEFIDSGCEHPISHNNCKQFFGCQRRANETANSGCPSGITSCDDPIVLPCLMKFVMTEKCKKVVTDGACGSQFVSQCQRDWITEPVSPCHADPDCTSDVAQNCTDLMFARGCKSPITEGKCWFYIPCQVEASKQEGAVCQLPTRGFVPSIPSLPEPVQSSFGDMWRFYMHMMMMTSFSGSFGTDDSANPPPAAWL